MNFPLAYRIALVLLVAIYGCSEPQAVKLFPRNVYIITATGLRADHLSSYMYQPIQTPGLDYLAYDGVRFTKAFSTSTDSLPAHQSIFAGLYPNRKLPLQTYEYFQTFTNALLPETKSAIPVMLREKGYRTAAFAADPELRSFVLRSGWFDKTYAGDLILPPWQPSSSSEVIRSLTMDWVSAMRGHPHFVFMNFFEPTQPYDPPEPYSHHYENHPYDGEVAAIDEQVGRFIHWLKQAKLFDESIVIFAAPYGENPDRAGRLGTLQDENLKVPLMIAAPGLLPRQQMYETTVSLADVYPTVLALLNHPVTSEIDGIRLFEKNSDKQIMHDAIYGGSLFPMQFGEPALTSKLNGNFSVADPKFLQIEEALILSRSGQRKEALNKLQGAKLPDTPSLRAFHAALFAAEGRLDDAEKTLGSVSQPELLIQMADLQVKQGKIKQAYETLCKYKGIISYDFYSTMSIVHRTAGNFGEAEKNAAQALKLNPRSAAALQQQALISLARKDFVRAEILFRKVLQLQPKNLDAKLSLAETLLKLDKTDEAKRMGAEILIQSATPEIRERARKLIAE
jgi:hypothetical protein